MANMANMAPGPDSKSGRGELRARVVKLLKWTSPKCQSGWPAGMAGFHGDGWHLGGDDGGDGGGGGGGGLSVDKAKPQERREQRARWRARPPPQDEGTEPEAAAAESELQITLVHAREVREQVV